jgi:hypothetical protein
MAGGYGYGTSYRPMSTFPQFAQTASPLSEYALEESPQAGLQYWLQSARPSTAMNQNLQRMLSQIYDRFLGAHAANPTDPNMTLMRYLSRLDPYQQYMSSSPMARNEETRRYVQPVRVV